MLMTYGRKLCSGFKVYYFSNKIIILPKIIGEIFDEEYCINNFSPYLEITNSSGLSK